MIYYAIKTIGQMNAFILFIIGIPLIEIYLMIKVGGAIGAFNTIFLIFFTAVAGIFFARLEGFRALRSGFQQIVKNELPIYEIISGAALAFAALLLIIPITRKILIKNISSKYKSKVNENIVEGTYEETKDDSKDDKLIK